MSEVRLRTANENALPVRSLAQHLRIKYEVSQQSLQSALGCSYYLLKKLLDGVRVPTSPEVRALRELFPEGEYTAKKSRAFEPYDLAIEKTLKDPRRSGRVAGTLRNTDSESRIRAATPLDPERVLSHAISDPKYARYASPASKCSLHIRAEHQTRLSEVAEALGESRSTALRRVLNFVFYQLQDMSPEDIVETTSSDRWALDSDPVLQEVVLESRKSRKVPEPLLTKTIKKSPKKKAKKVQKEEEEVSGSPDIPEDFFSSEDSEGDTEASGMFTLASSRVWNPSLLTPAMDEEQDS